MSPIAGLLLGALTSWSACSGGDGVGEAANELVAVDVEIRAPAVVPEGRPVPFAIRITNRGEERVVLELLGRQPVFDILVWDEDGAVVWSRLGGDPAPAIVRLEPLKPGAALEWTHEWDQRSRKGSAVPPGRYLVGALVPTSGEPLRAGPVSLTIEAGPRRP